MHLIRFALVLILGVEVLLALNPEYSIYQYTTRTWRRPHGLPANAIYTIAQANDGHVWLGTSKGLVDFDGVEFHVVGLPGQEDSRPCYITGVESRAAGGLWVGVERGGFGYFDAGRFVPVQGMSQGIEYPTTRVVHEGRDGSLYAAFVGRSSRRTPEGKVELFASDLDILCMHEDRLGRIWIGTASNGLKYWMNGSLHSVGDAADALWKGFVISSVVVDRAGVIWVGASNGLHRLNSDLTPGAPTGVGKQPKALLVDSHGILWVGTLAGGLVRYKDGHFATLHRHDGLASDRILALAESQDGSLWVGTEDGLSQLADVKFPILAETEGLASDSCLCVASSAQGGIWAGTSNGLSRIKDGRVTNFGVGRTDGFPSEWVRRVYETRTGDLLILGGLKDINLFRNGRVVRSWTMPSWPGAVGEDSFGPVASVGDQLVRLEGDSWVPLEKEEGSHLDVGWINSMVSASDGSLWMASKGGVYQLLRGKVIPRSRDIRSSDTGFYHLCEDNQGFIWGVRDTGLVRFKGAEVSAVKQAQGLRTELIYSMVAGLDGNFWVDSAEGIYRVSQRELNAVADGHQAQVNCVVYDGQHVVKTSDKSTREYASCRSLDGRLWFPSSKGVIQVNPAAISMNGRPPPVYLTKLRVDGREYQAHVAPALEPGSGNLEFEYAALDFQAPERIRYRYRLEGFQSEWVDAGMRRSAFYTNLNPGRYVFHVQACNADGVWNTKGDHVALDLPPRLVDTRWFKGCVLLIVFSIPILGLVLWDRRRRRAFAEIHRREELQRQMLDGSPVAMVMVDDRRQVLYLNAAFENIFGYKLAEVHDLGEWLRLACPELSKREEILRLVFAEARGREDRSVVHAAPFEANLVAKDGSERSVVFRIAEAGGRTLVVFSDHTERKRAEDERRRLEEQLRQGQKMEAIGQLSGGVAHDFNNLLTVILGNVSLIESDERIPSDLGESVDEIKGAAKRASNLTRQLLAFSRKQTMRVVTLDLNHVVADMTRMLKRVLGEQVQMELRPAPVPVIISADVGMVEQVILNLAINARDAMPLGGRLELRIEILDTDESGRMACLSVQDNGCGIPPEVMPRIFEPFFTTKDVGKGTGLGLATVYGIVQQHKGWIDVSSEEGKGTLFMIHLPLVEGETPALAPSHSTRGAEPGTSVGSRVFLVVEDDPGVRNLARRTLLEKGHQVFEAGSGAEALELWRKHKASIDILFTDVVMPGGLGGLELARQLQTEKPGLRVFYASGYSVEVAGGHFAGREGVDFLPKPYMPEDLLRMLAQALG